MKSLPLSKIRNLLLILAFMLLAGGMGYRLGERRSTLQVTNRGIIINTTPPVGSNVDFSLFWDVWSRLNRYYIDAASIDSQKMVYGAISGMVASLGDPYTAFLPPSENNAFKQEIGGSFEGIGAQLELKNNHINVVAPLKGTPAEAAGIKPNDYIMKVNGEDTTGWTVEQAVNKIKGPRGTKVTLTVLHADSTKPEDLVIIRATITVPSVVYWIKKSQDIKEISGLKLGNLLNNNQEVAYIQLSRFGDNTNDEWLKAVDQIISDGKVAGLIFDLRNNPGGYLEGSVFIASEFLKSGIVVTQTNSDGSKIDYTVNRKGKLTDIPLVVLVNKGSASAAEIVTGTLQDYKRGTIVGETTFGKGSVQSPQDLPGGSSLHVTTGKWLLPKGEWINKIGVKPDVEVVQDENATASEDAQLIRAIELLLK